MTINQLLETVMGKACVLKGEYGDATPFEDSGNDKAEKICNELGKQGFEKHGWEVMYNGFTGEEIEAKIMIGICYYQRLKHMVHDKMHSRGRGNVTTLFRQPLEGADSISKNKIDLKNRNKINKNAINCKNQKNRTARSRNFV